MQGSFNINIPTIPTNLMKFKIKDLRQKGFCYSAERFKDDKSYLTNKFIHSFNNLSSISQPSPQATNQCYKNKYINNSSFFIPQNNNFSVIVPPQKRHLLLKMSEIQNKMNRKKTIKVKRGLKFQKVKDSLNDLIENQQNLNNKNIQNYYFTNTEQSIQQDLQKHQKHIKPSAVFKNQQRWMQIQRNLRNNQIPGPGSYLQQKKQRLQKSKSKQKIQIKKTNDIQIIKQIMSINNNKQIKKQKSNQKTKKNSLVSSVFVKDSLDRFGKPVYPIAYKNSIPGPGSYSINNSMQDKVYKILLIEQQRKLLKQYYDEF